MHFCSLRLEICWYTPILPNTCSLGLAGGTLKGGRRVTLSLSCKSDTTKDPMEISRCFSPQWVAEPYNSTDTHAFPSFYSCWSHYLVLIYRVFTSKFNSRLESWKRRPFYLDLTVKILDVRDLRKNKQLTWN